MHHFDSDGVLQKFPDLISDFLLTESLGLPPPRALPLGVVVRTVKDSKNTVLIK